MNEDFTEEELRYIRQIFKGFKSHLGVSKAAWPLFSRVTDKVNGKLLTFIN